jgi:hypothetical protein
MSREVYWTMKNGTKINVDHMGQDHLRNTLKMIVRSIEKKKSKKEFQFNGEIAQEMHDNMIMEELMGDLLNEWYEQF